MPQSVARTLTRCALLLIAAYRSVSRFLPPVCRFYPSCSCYAQDAIERFGLLTGFRMALIRILHCHPFHPGGYDPVPETRKPCTRFVVFNL